MWTCERVFPLCSHLRCVRNWWLCCGPSTPPKTRGENTSDGGKLNSLAVHVHEEVKGGDWERYEERRGASGCWVRRLILRQQVILFWFSTRDQAKIWILPAPSSFTFLHSSRGTHAHLFHPFSFSRSHTFVLYMLTQVRSWLGKQEIEMKRKSLWGGGEVWETGDDKKKSTKIPVRICVAFDQEIPEANFHLFLNVHLICILTHKRLFSSIFWQYWTIVTAAPSVLHLWMVESWRKKNNVTQIPALFKTSSTFSTW